jgi:hypothetical protein
LIGGKTIEREAIYSLTVRDYLYEGFDGYDELPKCENIDKCTDIATMLSVALKFFELVKSLTEEAFSAGLNELEPGSYGFDHNCEEIFSYMRKVVIFNNGHPEISIESVSRIHKIE